jgi:hypothetical protein
MVTDWWETEGVVDTELGRANAVRREVDLARRSLGRAQSLLAHMAGQEEELDNAHQLQVVLGQFRADLRSVDGVAAQVLDGVDELKGH